MKKTYLSLIPLTGRPWLWVLLLVGLFAPFAVKAQTFTETMGSIQSLESVDAAYARGAFDNNATFVYSGDAYGGATSVGNQPTNPPVIFFGGARGAVGTEARVFQIAGINTSTVANASLRFSLYGDPAGNSSATFTVESSANGGAFVPVPYTDASTTSNTWTTKTASLPSSSNLVLRFTKVTSAVANRFRLDNVQVFSSSPTIAVNPAFNNFSNQTVNTVSAGVPFAVQATNLGTTGVSITAPANFQVSATQNGTYSSSLLVPATNGGVNTTIYVRFAPTAAVAYNGNVTFTSGTASTAVFVAGQGTTIPSSLTITPTSLPDFGSVQSGQFSAAQTFAIEGRNLTGNVTVTPPTGFQIRLPGGTFSMASIILVPANSSVDQTVEVRFQPNTTGPFNGQVAIATPGANGSVAVSGTSTAPPAGPFIVANPTQLDFGPVSANGSAQALSFSINAGNLTSPLTLTASNANISFRDATSGGSFTPGPLVINAPDGTVSVRTIEVRLVPTVAGGAFTGNITATSNGAPNVVVSITANSSGQQPVINTSGTINQFSTVPGVPSAAQSYLLSGTNLLEGITVAAPQFYQVSLDPNFTGITTTGNTIVVPRDNGNDVLEKRVYVRFFPPSALSASSNAVINSSPAAQGRSISVSGTSEPLIAIDNAYQQVFLQIVNTKSTAQLLNIRAERVRQPITITKTVSDNSFNPSATPQFELSLDGVTYAPQVTLMPNATTFSINQPLYVRYAPTYLGNAQSTLQFQSNDFADTRVRPIGANDLLSGNSIDTQPTLRSVATVVRSGSTATVSFNLPNNFEEQGYGEGRIIIASTNPELPGDQQPADGRSYQTGNQRFGFGDEVTPGYFVVYAGPNQSVVIENLTPATTYYFYVFEYNNVDESNNVSVNNAENYLNPAQPNTIPGILAPSPLPVTLVSFSAKASGNRVILNWETASELNNKQFEVQRSRDAQAFETILTRQGKGTTNVATTYSEVDDKPFNGQSYYRLKQVDLDGTASFSSTVAVNFLSSGAVSMYPNPVGQELTIEVGGSTEGMSAVVMDLTGRVISTQKLPANGKLDVSNLQAGTYMVTVGSGEAKVTRRIVKK